MYLTCRGGGENAGLRYWCHMMASCRNGARCDTDSGDGRTGVMMQVRHRPCGRSHISRGRLHMRSWRHCLLRLLLRRRRRWRRRRWRRRCSQLALLREVGDLIHWRMRRAEVWRNDRLGGGRTVKLRARKGDMLVHARGVRRWAGGRRQLMKMRVVRAGVVHLAARRKSCGGAGGQLGSEKGWRDGAVILTWDGWAPLFCRCAVYLNALEWAFSRQ